MFGSIPKFMGSEIAKMEKSEGKAWHQVLAICIVSIGSFANGLAVGWTSPYSVVLAKSPDYEITEKDASFFIIVHPIGMLLSSLFVFKIAEYLGRKKSVLAIFLPHLISWIIVAFARTKWEFYASRMFTGLAECIMFCSVPPYIGEITTPTVRGYLGNFPVFIMNFGSFIMTVLGSYLSVKSTSYICMIFPLMLVVVGSLVLPESPYQLIRERRDSEARQCIRWLRRRSNVEEEFVSMKADVERQLSERGKWKDLLIIRSNRKALVAGFFLRFSQMMSGLNVFNTYTQVIFQKAGGDLTPQVSSMIYMGFFSSLLLVSSTISETFGRKTTYFYSMLCSGIVHILISVYFGLDYYGVSNLDRLSWVPLGGMVLWVTLATPGIAVVPTLMLGELFSVSVKSKAISILIGAFAVSVLFSSYLFTFLSENVSFYAPFLFYGVVCLISSILTLKLVPETKGKTLEQVQQELKNSNMNIK